MDADAPESSDAAKKSVAVCRGAARLCAAHARGGDDAPGAGGAAGCRDGTKAPVREGRSVEPHRLVQGARNVRGSGTGEALGREDAGRTHGGECRRGGWGGRRPRGGWGGGRGGGGDPARGRDGMWGGGGAR